MAPDESAATLTMPGPFEHVGSETGASAAHCAIATSSPGVNPSPWTSTSPRSGRSSRGVTVSVGVGIGPSGSKSTGADAVSPSCRSKATAEHTCGTLAQSSTAGGKLV